MPDFLLGLEYNLETTLLAAAISFVVSAILIWLMMAAASRSRLNQLRTTLEKEITSSEQQRMQLGTDLNSLQQKNQLTELKITEQAAQIAELEKNNQELEKDKQAAETEAKRTSMLELSLNQKNQEFAQLTQRLQESENKQESLKQSWEVSLAEKDAAINELTTELNQQKAQVSQIEQKFLMQQTELAEQAKATQQQLEQNLQQLQTEFAQLQQAEVQQQQQLETALQELHSERQQSQQNQVEQQQQAEKKLQELQTALTQAQQSKLEQQQQLEGATLQLERLEERLTDRSAKSAGARSPETLAQQQTIERLQESNQALERKLLESEAAIKELVAKNAKKPATVELELTQKIAELNTALAEQGNYIFRLEYDLEVKKALMSDKNSPLKTIPAAIIAKQEQAEARIIELEQKLNPKRKEVKKTVEKTQASPVDMLNPAKQQIDEIADKAKHLPDQFKGFYQKILAKKTEETASSKPSESVEPKKSQPKKQAQVEEKSVAENKDSSNRGLKGFFKKLDKQAEVVEPLNPSDAKKSKPVKQTQSEEVASENKSTLAGLKGFFKKLDNQAEIK